MGLESVAEFGTVKVPVQQALSSDVYENHQKDIKIVLSLVKECPVKSDLVWLCAEKEMSQDELEIILDELKNNGIIYESRKDYFETV